VVSTLVLFRREWLRIARKDWLFFAAYGLIGVAGGFFLYFTAIDLAGVAIAAILLYTYPAFVTILSAIFLHERFTVAKGVALVLVLIGAALVSEIGASLSAGVDLRGVGIALLSAVAVASHSVFGKKAVQRYNSWTILLYSMGFGALFLIVAQFLFLGVPNLVRPPAFWGLLIALAWISTLGANLAYISALARIEASQASITASIEPVIVVLLAYPFFGETLSLVQISGMVLVMVGVFVVQR